MIKESLVRSSRDKLASSRLSNVNTGTIDCVIKSDFIDQGSLYVGDQKGVENIKLIKSLNVKSILTCSEGCKLNYTTNDIPNYKFFPFPSSEIVSFNDYFRTATLFIKETLKNSNVNLDLSQCIIHCADGQSKSITVIIAYLINYQKMGFDQAYNLIRNIKKNISLNSKYIQALKQFQKHLQRNNDNKSRKSFTKNDSILSGRSHKIEKLNQSQDSQAYQNPQNAYGNSNKSYKYSKHNELSFQLSPSKIISETKKSKNSVKKNNLIESPRRYQTSKSYLPNDQSFVQNQPYQALKFKTQNVGRLKSEIQSKDGNSSIRHEDIPNSNKILSSYRVQYIGVKRQPKSSKSPFKKQKPSSINFNFQHQQSQNVSPNINYNYLVVENSLNKSRISSKSDEKLKTQISRKFERNSFNRSMIVSSNQRQQTKKTEMIQDNQSFLRVFNPQVNQLSKSRISQYSKQSLGGKNNRQKSFMKKQTNLRKSNVSFSKNDLDISDILGNRFEISPSKREQFTKMNNQLNENFKKINECYLTEMTDLRTNYHNRLRHLRSTNKQTQQVDKAA